MDCKKCKSCKELVTHKWRFQCADCRCPNYCHISYVKSLDITGQNSVNWIDNLNTESHNQLNDYKTAISMAESNNLVWLPIGLQQAEISDFIQIWNEISELYSLENNSNNHERKMAILFQIPECDRSSRVNMKSSNDKDEDELIIRLDHAFKKSRDVNYLGFGEIEQADLNECCNNCEKQFRSEDIYCIRITHSATFASHISCFKCKTCKKNLVDFHYCWNNDTFNTYCLRHFGEINYSRCAGCDELILNKDFTKAMEKEFHVEHFACHKCDTSLTGAKYILKNEDPYCLTCFEELFGNTCDRCLEKISCNSKDLTFKDRHWHDKCFHCDNCHETLVDKPFATKENDLYCPDCYEEKFSAHCDGCNQIFKSGIKKYEYGGKQWHEHCFICDECNESIGAKSFIPSNGKMFCMPCYENKHAHRCSKCTEIIRKGGVTYKGDPWHKECFLCTNCKKMLSNTKFTSKDEKPYCSECFAELFSKRCKKCANPITGFGGCKFISVEEDNWHPDCFNCSECSINLVEKGFVFHGGEPVCADCGRTTFE